MRKLAFLTLGMYLTIFFSSVSMAAKVNIKGLGEKVCPGITEKINLTVLEAGGEAAKTESEKATTNKKNWDKETSTPDANNCGKENPTNYGLEQADCAAADPPFIITKINEPVGPATTTSDGKIIDVYQGICCLLPDVDDGKPDTNTLCGETRTVTYLTYTNCNTNAVSCSKIQWLMGSTGAGIIKLYVKQIYVFGAGIVGFIAVITIVFSGIQISVSGVSGDITASKDRIIQSIMGIVLLFLSGLILYTINPTFFN